MGADTPNLVVNTTDVKVGFASLQGWFGLYIGEEGKLPRVDGNLNALEEIRAVVENARVQIDVVQVPYFNGTDVVDANELLTWIKETGAEAQMILMIGTDPMVPENRTTVINELREWLEIAKNHGVKNIAATGFEAWMSCPERKGEDFDAAVATLATLYADLYEELKLWESSIENIDMEFLRKGEMNTFTDIEKAAVAVRAINAELSRRWLRDKPFYRVMPDSAHMGDSELSRERNEAAMVDLASTRELGNFHYSTPTYRWDDSASNWANAHYMSVAVRCQVWQVCWELFNPNDPILKPLKTFWFGLDTNFGNSREATVRTLENMVRQLVNAHVTGQLPAEKTV